MEKIIKGFKAFNKDMTCKGFQYKEGETYECEKASVCNGGFHFCENPLDTLSYYDLCESVFHKVEGLGKFDKHKEDSKVATTEIKIGVRLTLGDFIKASFDYLWSKCKTKKSGDYSKLAASGDSSKLAASGDYSQLAASGYSSQLELNGNHSVGANIGIYGSAKGKKGCWITLAEYGSDCKPICVKSRKIDGKRLKEDTWYRLKGKKFVEIK